MTNLEDQISFWLKLLAVKVFKEFAERLKQYQINSTESFIIQKIHQSDLIDSHAELSEYLNINKSSISLSVDRLVKKGIVIRNQDIKDRRRQNLSLSKEGIKIAKNLTKLQQRTEERFFSSLSHSQKKKLLNTFKKLSQNKKAKYA